MTTTTRNAAGGIAYSFTSAHGLAQLAVTGTLRNTFYASGVDQTAELLALAAEVPAETVAKTAVYAAEQGFMKEVPALLLAHLMSRREHLLVSRIFGRIVRDGRNLRKVVKHVTSGVCGFKSLGSATKREILNWLGSRTDEQLLRDSVGASPSIGDVLYKVHAKATSEARGELYRMLLGRSYDAQKLPALAQHLVQLRRGERSDLPQLPFELLTSAALDAQQWKQLALAASYQATMKNLATFARHGVFEDSTALTAVCDRLRNPEAISAARIFPYQLLSAYCAAGTQIPGEVREALHDALEIATENVPALAGKVVICPDVSGSMQSSITGERRGATSAVRVIDVAGLVTAALLRKNPTALVLPFDTETHEVMVEPRDTVMTNARRLAEFNGGGTDCSQPLAWLNAQKRDADVVIFVSDNESWAGIQGRPTGMFQEWQKLKQRCPKARLVCIDVQPNADTQVQNSSDVLNIGGFSDNIFPVIDNFLQGRLTGGHWAELIEQVEF